MPHVALLGDSIFDNAAYVRGGPDVVTQLQERLPSGWRASLLAVDGAVIGSVPAQLARLPADVTHLVLSVGGNDALRHAHLLPQRASTVLDALTRFADAVEPFAQAYRKALEAVVRARMRVVVCTIYDGRLAPELARGGRVALAIFNDAVQREATRAGLPVIELREVCTEAGDYANPIEPSVRGGAKIAAAIAAHLTRR